MDKIIIKPKTGLKWQSVQVPPRTQFWFLTATALRPDSPGTITVNDRRVVAVERGTVYLNYSAPAGSVIRVHDCSLCVMNATDEAISKLDSGVYLDKVLNKWLNSAVVALITFCIVYFSIMIFR